MLLRFFKWWWYFSRPIVSKVNVVRCGKCKGWEYQTEHHETFNIRRCMTCNTRTVEV